MRFDKEKSKITSGIISKAFTDTCAKYKCDKENIKGCVERFIPARTYFIKQCGGVPLASIGEILGGRTVDCINNYLNGVEMLIYSREDM